MASCSLGTSCTKITNLNLGRTRVGSLQSCGQRTVTVQRPQSCSSLSISRRSEKVLHVCSAPDLELITAPSLEESSEEIINSSSASLCIPNFDEIQSLLSTICDTTSVAEVELRLGGFRLHVLRDLTEKVSTPPPPNPAPVSASTTADVADSNGSLPTQSLAITRVKPSSRDIQTLLHNAADEGLVLMQCPTVGRFRRGRMIKKRRAPPSCEEKKTVKEGQVLCYIEQLGGNIPVRSDISGEVVKILRKDGEPVGYGDVLMTILPSFPGIKKLK